MSTKTRNQKTVRVFNGQFPHGATIGSVVEAMDRARGWANARVEVDGECIYEVSDGRVIFKAQTND